MSVSTACSSTDDTAAPPVKTPTKELSLRANGGGPSIILRQPNGYSAEILFYGGQVISWKNEHGEELLFVSKKAVFEAPHPIRGGIPICFPKFFNNESIEQHGFARRRFWSVDDAAKDDPDFPPPPPDNVFVDLILDHMPRDFTNWPHSFELRLRVVLEFNGDLMLISRVTNVNADANSFTFPFSYQTYFFVSDISTTQIEGLDTVDYLDYLQNKERFTQEGALTFQSEVNRVYINTPSYVISVTDNELKRTYTITKNGSLPDFVVWNPWEKKAKEMADLEDIEYRQMVCVEAASVENEIKLNPGETWMATLHLSIHED